MESEVALLTVHDSVDEVPDAMDAGLPLKLEITGAGITHFDSSLGGIGGCPFAPGATGNISTEDLVHMLHEMGIETGIDLDVLLEEGKKLKAIVGHELASQVIKAGTSSTLRAFEGIKFADSRSLHPPSEEFN